MRYIQLKEDAILQLQKIIKTDSRHKSRMRAQALLLSNQGKKITEIVDIIGYSQRTLYRWFDRFIQEDVATVHELEGRGRKPKLRTVEHEAFVNVHIKKL